MEIVRRIDRGQLTGTLLSRQTGLRAPHLSNFIRGKRKLSLSALDRVLAAQLLSVEDLLPEASRTAAEAAAENPSIVPVVSAATALNSPHVNQRSILQLIHLPAGMLDQLHARRTLARRDWQRFVAVRLSPAHIKPMEPVLTAGMVVVLDRHYNSLAPHHPSRPNVYAVDLMHTLAFRYVSYDANRLILRPHALDSPVELLKLGSDQSPSALIVGRVCVAISEL